MGSIKACFLLKQDHAGGGKTVTIRSSPQRETGSAASSTMWTQTSRIYSCNLFHLANFPHDSRITEMLKFFLEGGTINIFVRIVCLYKKLCLLGKWPQMMSTDTRLNDSSEFVFSNRKTGIYLSSTFSSWKWFSVAWCRRPEPKWEGAWHVSRCRACKSKYWIIVTREPCNV